MDSQRHKVAEAEALISLLMGRVTPMDEINSSVELLLYPTPVANYQTYSDLATRMSAVLGQPAYAAISPTDAVIYWLYKGLMIGLGAAGDSDDYWRATIVINLKELEPKCETKQNRWSQLIHSRPLAGVVRQPV